MDSKILIKDRIERSDIEVEVEPNKEWEIEHGQDKLVTISYKGATEIIKRRTKPKDKVAPKAYRLRASKPKKIQLM